MYDINTKKIRKNIKIFGLFLFVGLLILIGLIGFIIYNNQKEKKLDSTTTATNIVVKSHIDNEGMKMYSPIYYYEVDGVEYTCASKASSSKYPDTNNKKVYYESKNPSNCMSEYSKTSNKLLILFLFLPFIFIAIGAIGIGKINKKVKILKELNKKGKLIKNIPYYIKNSNVSVNDVPIPMAVIEYTLPSGEMIILHSEPMYDGKIRDKDGMVDLVIDEDNPKNYYIDLEINRLTGNLKEDYFNQNINNQVDQNKI